jgi:pimeloyl-ACP methyl ester carboxylesterase
MKLTDVARLASTQLLLVSPPRRQPSAANDAFYLPPERFGPGRPGELLKAEPMDAYLVPGARMRARAWRILYRSTSALGEPRAVSGTVLLPARRGNGPRPLIGYAIGTHGIGDSAAPSRLLARGLDWEAGLMAMLLARGWGVAITDYEGLGTPGDHTYMVGRALGPNVLDSMRAARELHPTELPDDGPAAIVGYSEGGFAAAWAAQLQPEYAPDLKLAGVAAGAAAANVEAAGPGLEGSFFSFFIAYGGIGYAAAYPELDLDSYLTPKAKERIGFLRESNVLQAAARGPHHMRASELTDPNVLEMPAWRRRLRENRLGLMKPDAPVLLHHARRDQIVSFVHSLDLRDDWSALGADVRLYVTRGGVDHITGAMAGMPIAVDWLSKRIARRSAWSPGLDSAGGTGTRAAA